MVSPVGPQNSPPPIKSDEAKKRAQKEELLLLQALMFMNMMNNSSTSHGSDKKGRVEEVEKELQEGKISPMQAAAMIMSILLGEDNSIQKSKTLNPDKIETHMNLFLETMKLHHEDGQSPIHTDFIARIEQTINHSKEIPSQQAATELHQLVKEANRLLPESMRYPDIDPKLFK